jgi:hypothetical protein
MDSDYHFGFVTFPSELTPFIILTVCPGPLWVLVKVAQALSAPKRVLGGGVREPSRW